MFSLKSDLFFPTIELAKAIARKFNERRWSPPVSTIDPREARRIRLELELARDKAKVLAIAHRHGRL